MTRPITVTRLAGGLGAVTLTAGLTLMAALALAHDATSGPRGGSSGGNTRSDGDLFLPNARFTTPPTPTTPYWVTGIDG